MTSTLTSAFSTYATAYRKGRHAAQERVSPRKNPYRAGGTAFHAWNDGFYDEQSARRLAVERHSAQLWSADRN